MTLNRPRSRHRLAALVGVAVVSLTLTVAPAANAAESSLTVDRHTITTSEKIQISADAGDDVHAKNWIGIYPNGVTPSGATALDWRYVPEKVSTVSWGPSARDGWTKNAASIDTGEYDLYLFKDDGHTALSGPVDVTVVRPPLERFPYRVLGEGIPESVQAHFGTGTKNRFSIGRPLPGGSSAGKVPAGLEEFYAQSVTWGPCEGYVSEVDKNDRRLSCGYAIVPLDFSDPSGPTIAVAMLKAHTGDTPKKGTLFLDPGGPGGSGMSTVAGRADNYEKIGLLEDFDIIGFDPRGVSSSAPAIQCYSNSAIDAFRESSTVTALRNYMAIEGCKTNLVAKEYDGIDGGKFLQSVGTNNVVKDLDILRSIVGDERLNYLGYSYGTSIGYNYALQFPENIRAMVLDAIIDPFENNPEEKKKYSQFFQNGGGSQAESMAEAREQFTKRCEQEDGFDFNGTRIACAAAALGQQPTKPVWSPSKKRYLGVDDFTWAINKAMYSDALWPQLNAGLAALTAAQDPAQLLALADDYFGRQEDGSYPNGESAFTHIKYCADTSDPACSHKAMEPLRTGEPIPALTNVLVISGTYDNATAYPNGVVLAQAIEGTLLSVATNKHGSVGNRTPINCVDATAATYLRTLTILRDPGTRGVATKDIYSNPITGDQCQIDEQWRAIPTTSDQTATAGETLQVRASGLTRGGKYAVKVAAADGTIVFDSGTPIVAAADGSISIPVLIKNSTNTGDYRILIQGAEEITRVLNDATATLSVTGIVLPTPDAATIRLSTTSTSPDGLQTAFGTGFTAGADIALFLDNEDGAAAATVRVADDGTFTASLPHTGLATGSHTVLAIGEDRATRSAPFTVVSGDTVTPTVTVDRTEIRAGALITVTVDAFAPDTDVSITLHSTPRTLGTVTTDTEGRATATFRVPADAEPGAHNIVATDQTGTTASVAIRILPSAAPETGSLASTGGTASLPLIVLSVLALTAGGILLAYRRQGAKRPTNT